MVGRVNRLLVSVDHVLEAGSTAFSENRALSPSHTPFE